MSRILLALFAATAALAQSRIPDAKADAAKNATVMILLDGRYAGAGIIFGIRNQHVYIATARHVTSGTESARVQVLFRWLPGEPVDASVSPYHDSESEDLDLAVLVVDDKNNFEKTNAGSRVAGLDLLGDPARLANEALWAIGGPGGERWGVSPALYTQRPTVFYIPFEAPDERLLGGYSGGPVLNQAGLIVGMVRQGGKGSRVDLILTKLNGWEFPVDLRKPGTPAVSSAPPRPSETKNAAPAQGGLRFYESDSQPSKALAASSKTAESSFEQSSRFIDFEAGPFAETRGNFKAVYSRPDKAAVFCSIDKIKPVKLGGFAVVRGGCGSPGGWTWDAGKYVVAVYDGSNKKIAQDSFEVTETKTVVTRMRFYASETNRDTPIRYGFGNAYGYAAPVMQTARYIVTELALTGPATRDASYSFDLKWLKADGSVYRTDTCTARKAPQSIVSTSRCFASTAPPGRWEPGTYDIQLFNKGEKDAIRNEKLVITKVGLKVTISGVFIGPTDGGNLPAKPELVTSLRAPSGSNSVWLALLVSGPASDQTQTLEYEAHLFRSTTAGPYPQWTPLVTAGIPVKREAGVAETGWYRRLDATWVPGRYKVQIGEAASFFSVVDLTAPAGRGTWPPPPAPVSRGNADGDTKAGGALRLMVLTFRETGVLGASPATEFATDVRSISWQGRVTGRLGTKYTMVCKDPAGGVVARSEFTHRSMVGNVSGVFSVTGLWQEGLYSVAFSSGGTVFGSRSFSITRSAPGSASIYIYTTPGLQGRRRVFAAGTFVASVESLRYFGVRVAPGSRTFCIDQANQNCSSFNFDAGNSYSLEISAAPSGYSIKSVAILPPSFYVFIDKSMYGDGAEYIANLPLK